MAGGGGGAEVRGEVGGCVGRGGWVGGGGGDV